LLGKIPGDGQDNGLLSPPLPLVANFVKDQGGIGNLVSQALSSFLMNLL